ncbi:hypothetical protein SNE40_010361 [Patella caerulea]|uniref:Uncharacterized protein n=1 Tax=Patella caerulea TaxID=87958 RepID=A0AAN8JQC1_PATCE
MLDWDDNQKNSSVKATENSMKRIQGRILRIMGPLCTLWNSLKNIRNGKDNSKVQVSEVLKLVEQTVCLVGQANLTTAYHRRNNILVKIMKNTKIFLTSIQEKYQPKRNYSSNKCTKDSLNFLETRKRERISKIYFPELEDKAIPLTINTVLITIEVNISQPSSYRGGRQSKTLKAERGRGGKPNTHAATGNRYVEFIISWFKKNVCQYQKQSWRKTEVFPRKLEETFSGFDDSGNSCRIST